MKPASKNIKIKSLTVSISVGIALLLCAVVSFVMGYKPQRATAAVGDNGIRFVQVASGDDFAIGLTTDGELYGWSLLDTQTGVGTNGAATLGNYYTSIPTKIDFTFMQGPTNNIIDSSSGSYKTPMNDSIVQIAATRTSAAFITRQNRIYTWGKDKDIVYNDNGANYLNNLLLRRPDNISTSDNVWYKPYIISYDYYRGSDNVTSGLEMIIPSQIGGNLSIAAGENNYIITYKDSGIKWYSYVWGSVMYALPNSQPESSYVFPSTYNFQRTLLNVFYIGDSTTAYTAVAGGYTVGYNGAAQGDGTSLSLRGKNFVTTQNAADSGSTTTGNKPIYNISQTVEPTSTEGQSNIVDIGTVGATVNGAIIGAHASGTVNNGVVNNDGSDKYYGRQKAAPGASLYSANSQWVSVVDSDGTTELGGTGTPGGDNSVYKAINYAVSLGNDIGYGISDGKLYAWGDNSQGQAGGGTKGGINSAPVVNSTPTPITISGMATNETFYSVAAGKQRSGAQLAFNTVDTFNGLSFNANVKNEENYISGAVTSRGDLYLWSNADPRPTKVTYGNTDKTNNNNKFIAVYSGYGNRIFAVTKLGNLVLFEAKDGGYAQTIYDKFVNGTGEVTNWTLTSAKNSVQFKVATPTAADRTPSLGSAIFYLDGVYADQTTIELNGRAPTANTSTQDGALPYNTMAYSGGSLIATNAVHDHYRILDHKIDASGVTFVDTTSTGKRDINQLSAAEIKPKFTYNGKLMTDEQQENMFSYSFYYSQDDRVGIKIEPHRSSKGLPVSMSFVIARYDSSANFTITGRGAHGADGVTVTDNAVYYDHKTCSVEFTIDNTPAYVSFADFKGDRPTVEGGSATDYTKKPTGNSIIPLLDPNNEYNKYYSLAVQDIVTGSKKLVEYLTKAEGVGVGNTFYDAIVTAMKSGDSGFPDSRKISDGNLVYYLGADAAADAYNDEYKYLFSDRDSDLLIIPNTAALDVFGLGVTGGRYPINIKLSLDSSVDAARVAAFDTDFLNLYGIYNVSFTKAAKENDSDPDVYTEILFTYDVVRFTATGSSGAIRYTESGDHVDVTSYITTNGENGNASWSMYAAEYTSNVKYSNTAVLPETTYFTNVATVFSQPTLRLSQTLTDDLEYVVYGDADAGKNKYTLTDEYIRSKGFRVGETKTIELSELVGVLSGQISFSYNNTTTASDFAIFNKQFYDELAPNGNVVTLTSNRITITPTTTRAMNFEVTLQRFDVSGATFGNDEKITITVNISTITDFSLTAADVTTNFNISDTTVIDVLGGNGAINSRLIAEDLNSTYTDRILISQVRSTDTSVATATITSGSHTSITVTPVAAGSTTVMFVMSIYGKSLPLQVSFNVAGLTAVTGTIELNDITSVYVNDLLIPIRAANSFVSNINGYGVIYDDMGENGIPNAVYFTDKNGERVAGLPWFVGSVRFTDTDTSNPRLRLEINDNVVNNSAEEYYLRIKFVDKNLGYTSYEQYENDARNTGAVLTTSQRIISTKSVVMGGSDGNDANNPYVVNIDCDNAKPRDESASNSDWYTVNTKTGIRAYVPIRLLLNLIGESNPEDYKGTIARSDSSTSNYMYYEIDTTGNYVVITPLYNTLVDENGIAEPVVISISVSPINPGSERSTRTLSFRVTVSGISTTLSKDTYTMIWLVAFFSSLALLLIIFLIRMIVYWRKKAKQRALIKRNQELIKMRDRVHNKASSATREQAIRTKLKMNDPKYARMLGDMKRERAAAAQDSTGVMLENADMPGVVPPVDEKGKKKKKKKGGKKSIAELKAELEAKKAAVLAAQQGGVPPFGAEVPIDAPFGMPDQGFGEPTQGFGEPTDAPFFGEPAQDIDGEAIIFDSPDDGVQG